MNGMENYNIFWIILLISLVLTSCEIYQTVYPTNSTKDKESISKSGINIERQTKIEGESNVTIKYIESRINIEKEDAKHSIVNRYLATLGFIGFLFFSAYLTYKYKIYKLKKSK